MKFRSSGKNSESFADIPDCPPLQIEVIDFVDGGRGEGGILAEEHLRLSQGVDRLVGEKGGLLSFV